MSRFGPDPLDFFNFVYTDVPPWDIGGPQPAMSALLDRFPPMEPILDVGCGSGDLAIYLAQTGYRVTGIDFVETAIGRAREKAGSLPAKTARLLDFQVADALNPSQLQRQFGSVVDSGFYHLFELEQCKRFIDELSRVLLPGGRYFLHAFAIELSMPNLPPQVSAEEVEEHFTPEKGWHILDIKPVEFLNRVAPPVQAISACIERHSSTRTRKPEGNQ